MTDTTGFDATNRTIDRRPEVSALIAIGIGWAIVVSFAAMISFGAAS